MPAKPISDPVSFRRTTHHDEILREAGYDVASIQNLRGLPGRWGEVRRGEEALASAAKYYFMRETL